MGDTVELGCGVYDLIPHDWYWGLAKINVVYIVYERVGSFIIC